MSSMTETLPSKECFESVMYRPVYETSLSRYDTSTNIVNKTNNSVSFNQDDTQRVVAEIYPLFKNEMLNMIKNSTVESGIIYDYEEYYHIV